MNTCNWVIIHHTAAFATKNHQFDSVDRYHKSKGWKKIGYQWFLEADGTIKRGRDEKEVGAHTTQWLMNYRSIGVCLAGDFDKQDPSPEQIESLLWLLTDIQFRHGIRDGKIKFHREFAKYKSCPGTRFTWDWFEPLLRKRRTRFKIKVEPEPDLAPSHE